MPDALVLASHPRGGRIVPARLALRAGSAEASGAWGEGAELSGCSLQVEVIPRGAAADVRIALRNDGAAPRSIDAVELDFDWQAPGSQPPSVLALGFAALAGERGGGACAGVGSLASGRCLARARARPGASGASLVIELLVGAQLEAGETRELDAVEVSVGDDATRLLEDYAERWGRAQGARSWRPAPLVWALDPAPEGQGEASLTRVLAALAAHRDELPVEAVVLPTSTVRAAGDWSEAAPDHPRGLAAAAAGVRAAGLIAGLRVAPLLASTESAVFRAHPEWFADPRRPDGLRVLDPTRDGALDHLERCFCALHQAGFFFFELEALDADLEAVARDPGRGPAERLRSALEAVRRGASDEAFLLASDGPPDPGLGVVDAVLAGGPDPEREALRRTWMHRRLWLCASSTPEAAETGAMLVARGDPQALGGEELKRWSRAARIARRADEGVPGAARLADPLDPSPRLATDPVAAEAPPALAVFCDFDGTFSVQDVGATLAVRHGGERRAQQWARYERGEITPWDYNLEILDGLPLGAEALDAFLASVDLDPGARNLLDWCGARRVPFRILSDGFDWNLNRLQQLHGVRFAYTANRLRIEHGRWRIGAGAPDPRCGCGTGTCKGAALRAYRARHPESHLVHIGNGRVSDSCGAIEADTAFAKDSLAESLARRGEAFVPFETLHDVIPHLEQILGPAGARSGSRRLGPAEARSARQKPAL